MHSGGAEVHRDGAEVLRMEVTHRDGDEVLRDGGDTCRNGAGVHRDGAEAHRMELRCSGWR